MFAGAVAGGGTTVPEFKTPPIQKQIIFLNILFRLEFKSQTKTFKIQT